MAVKDSAVVSLTGGTATPAGSVAFSLCKVDGVTVTTADGRGVVYRQRDRAKMFALLRESLRRQLLLARKFNKMRKVYRAALPVLSSKQKWEAVLLESSPADG